ncbi:MAG TPA: hypothetical protein VKV95_14700 [Terriglobia bacterium]|nr:hypothetical protein [Terriglobia bacterium]
MSKMKRKQIYLEVDQDRRLGILARNRDATESELIRSGLDLVLSSPLPQALDHQAWLRRRRFIESMIRRGPVKGKRTWTREEAHER